MARRWQGPAILGVAITIALGVWLLSGPFDEPALHDTPDADVAGDERPQLHGAGAPVPKIADEAADTGAKPAEKKDVNLAALMGWANGKDDPALPKAREPLDVLVMDRSGTPVPRAIVVADWGEWKTRAFETDDEGRVVMQIAPNSRALSVVGQSGRSTGPFCFVHYHALSPGARSTRIVLRCSRAIRGHVDIGGRSPERGSVSAYRMGRPTMEDGERKISFYRVAGLATKVTVNPDGTFQLSVTDDMPVTLLYASSESDDAHRAIVKDVEPGTIGVRLSARVRKREATLRLRVLAPDGNPIVGFPVTCQGIGGQSHETQTTDENGRAPFEVFDGWLYRVVVLPSAATTSPWTIFSGTVVADGVEHEIRTEPAPADIEGTVVDERGRPVKGAWVCVIAGAEYKACMPTKEDGTFAGSANVPAGTRVHVYARFPMEKPTARGYAENVVVGDPVHLELEELGPLSAKAVNWKVTTK